ncbi:hypothetical protein TL16_g10373 [Triparma laevis f. inornata]|uniref:Prokaryotic-type class I peptide chain release factors domain-containing protein n=2 Tax=Triparma laevis TaxID=1534972 RepID=A0A9W7C6W3_9STRA|nr:hypothetical protein TL16_g10373 [Triparma laevis f. inornata]GMI04367.1 hypothetical protein TrLO_g9666 [Triparma laevis f. longispina]
MLFRTLPRSISSLPPSSYFFSFSRSSGAGGQNVNKLNTRVTLKLSLQNLPEMDRLKELNKNIIGKDNVLTLSSQVHRTQLKNKKDVLQKLQQILDLSRLPVKTRDERGDVITDVGKLKRKKEKGKRKDVKKNRGSFKDYD